MLPDYLASDGGSYSPPQAFHAGSLAQRVRQPPPHDNPAVEPMWLHTGGHYPPSLYIPDNVLSQLQPPALSISTSASTSSPPLDWMGVTGDEASTPTHSPVITTVIDTVSPLPRRGMVTLY